MLPGVGGQAVDVVAGQAGVVDGLEARVDGELERVAEQAAADVGLADAGDAPRSIRFTRTPASKNGSHTSSYCSNTTCTGMPIAHVVDGAADDVGQ